MGFKRITAAAAALLMTLSLAACGQGDKPKDDGSKQVTLRWAGSNFEHKDTAKVLTEINKRLETLLPNTKIEFVGQSPTNWQNWMAAKEVIDIAWTGFSYDVESEINKKAFMPLDDLIKNTTNIKQEMTDYAADYASGNYKGVQYMIPNQQPIMNETSIIKVPAELYQYMDVDALLKACHESPITTEKVYQVLDQYFEKITKADATDTDTIGTSCDILNLFKYVAIRGYDWVGGNQHKGSWMVYEAFNDDVKIVNFQETDAYKLFLKYAGKWFEKGYISKDILVNGGASGSRKMTLTAHSSGMWYGLDDPANGEARGVRFFKEDGETTEYHLCLDTHDEVFNGVSILGSEQTYTVIPYTSQNPERAMQLLDLLRSPKGTEGNDLLNLIVYGFEGEHYTLKDGDEVIGNGYTVQPEASAPYGVPHWAVGNVFLMYRTPNILKGQGDYAKQFETVDKLKLHKTPLYEFRADIAPVTGKIAQVQQVIAEYNDRLVAGINGANYQSLYDEMMKKMKTAGMEDIKTELNKQAQDYISSKK